jgi:hypothetical protein
MCRVFGYIAPHMVVRCVRLSLLGVFLLLSVLSGLEAVTGPGSRDPRSLDWSGGALAGTWVDLLLHAQ